MEDCMTLQKYQNFLKSGDGEDAVADGGDGEETTWGEQISQKLDLRHKTIKLILAPFVSGESGWTFDCLQNSFAFARPGKQVVVFSTPSFLTEKQDNQYHLRLRRYQTTHGW